MAGLSFRWRNFRSLEDTGWLTLRPLTVILGPNNSGKTSLIAPFLLLQQTLDSEDSSTALLTKGPLLDFGLFTDLVRNHDQEAVVTLDLCWHNHGTPEEADEPVGSFPPGGVSLEFERGDDDSVQLSKYEVKDLYFRTMMSRTRLKSGRFSLAGLRQLTDHVPVGGGARSDDDLTDTELKRRKEITKNIKNSKPDHFLFSGVQPIFDVAVRRSEHPDDEGPRRLSLIPGAEAQIYSLVNESLRQELREELYGITYLGPLRERARRYYLLSGEMPRNVGTRGEFAPEILFRWRHEPKKLSLVNEWLGRFGFADDLSLEPQGAGAFSLSWGTDKRGARNTAFVDMGFGLSQVLPLIVQGVLARKGSTIVAEQPEIHLNPRLQTVLAELFAWCIDREVNIVTETHSEHLLLTARRLIAEKELQSDQVALYFVERESRDSEIQEVPLGEDGHIPPENWPTGFFGDALRESLALSAAQHER
jgi:hypothetical protein